MRDGDRELAALQTVQRPPVVAHRARYDVSDFYINDQCVRTGADAVCRRGSAYRSLRTALEDCSGRCNRESLLRAGSRTCHWLDHGSKRGGRTSSRVREPFGVDPTDRPGSVPWLGAIARTVHGSTSVHHHLHSPAAVLPISRRASRLSASYGVFFVTASASGPKIMWTSLRGPCALQSTACWWSDSSMDWQAGSRT